MPRQPTDGVKVERSGGAYDVTFQKSSGQAVTNSSSAAGQALRIRTVN